MRLFEVANKGIPRSQMPQIHVDDIKDDFDYRQGKLSLKKMKPVQTERVESEYKKAVQKIKNKQAKPILLDKKLRIVNGHHRYDAYRHLGFDSVPAVIVDATLEDLMSKYQHTSEEAGAGGAGAGGGAAGGTGGATGSTGGATSSSGDSGSADSGDAGDSGSDSAEATPPPSRGLFYVGSMAPYKSSKKKKKKKKKKSSVEFGKSIYESLTMPKFDVEWGEAERYPEFRKIGKEAWIKLAKAGKAVTITDASDIENTDAGEPESFYNLDKDKQKRALQQIARGNVELPIVAVYSDGYKELIGGNTRLTAMMLRHGKAKVWQFEVPDKVATVAEGLVYYGNCTQDEVVDDIFGDVSEFARQVELHGDEFEIDNLVVKYDDAEDVHHFYMKENFADGTLYHATYKPLLKSIQANGLGGGGAQTKWTDSKPGVVYLAKDPDVAVSYAETNDEVPEEWLDQIVVLAISTDSLDTSKLKDDENVLDDDSTLEYHGVIKKFKLDENFADGKVKGKSRPGRVKKAGASCKGSVSSLRAKAKKYSGERGKMYHWCANMKGGKKK